MDRTHAKGGKRRVPLSDSILSITGICFVSCDSVWLNAFVMCAYEKGRVLIDVDGTPRKEVGERVQYIPRGAQPRVGGMLNRSSSLTPIRELACL